MKATTFLAEIRNMNASTERDALVLKAVRDGGMVPSSWVDVPLENNRGAFRVAADYFSIGDADDWVRVPVGGAVAQAIADLVGAVLPCGFMSDLIWRAAVVKLAPITRPTKGMTSTMAFAEHHAAIEAVRGGRAGLIAGIKKDVVITNKLEKLPQATAIYGWHTLKGEPIQKVSTAHHEPYYSDYSHGIRLVWPTMLLDGVERPVQEVMSDPKNAVVLTGGSAWGARHDAPNDAVLRVVRYPSAPSAALSLPHVTAPQPAKSDLGARALAWCVGELEAGVGEQPPGSNAGPRIAEYFAPARRRGTEAKLGISSGDWCAVAQSAALAAVVSPGEAVPHRYRAAVRELREDAQSCGAWVPLADLRSGAYTLMPGDLLVFKRGSTGLGHVSRVESSRAGVAVTIGGNESNKWTRRERRFDDQELEGAIRYRGFRPVLTLDAEAPLAVSAVKNQPKPQLATEKARLDSWAREIFLKAWQAEFGSTKPTTQETQGILAIARHERNYGESQNPKAGIGANNWGGVQCSPSHAHNDQDCYPGVDKDAAGNRTTPHFKRYPTPVDGARHLIQLVTSRRPHVWAALKSGDLTAVATEMGTERTINGHLYRIYHETKPSVYAAALAAHAAETARNLGEPLAVGLHGPTSTPSAPIARALPPAPPSPQPQPKPGLARTHGLQDGIRAIVASREPRLAAVIVGDGSMFPEEARLLAGLATAEQRVARLRAGLESPNIMGITTGIASGTSIKDHAARVDNYIRSLHGIIEAERKVRPQPDGFPWSDWAAFRVSWDMVLFDINHSILVWFDDSVVNTYDDLSRKWADTVWKYYQRRPETALSDPTPGKPNMFLWFALGTGASLLLSRWLAK